MTTQVSSIIATNPVVNSKLLSAPVRNNFGFAANDINNIYSILAVPSSGSTIAPTMVGGSIDGAPIGANTPSTGAFTTLSASVSFSTAAINSTPIGNVTPSTGAFTSLTTTGSFSASSINSTPIGNTTPSTGAFTSLSATGALTAASLNSTPVGNTTPSTGAFTSLSATGAFSAGSINSTPIGNVTPSTGAFTSLTVSGALSLGGLTVTSLTNSNFTTAGVVHNNSGGLFSTSLIVAADITNSTITYAKLQNETALTLLGNPTIASATPSEITLGNTLQFNGTALFTNALTGDVTTNLNSFVTSISPNAVTYAQQQQVSANCLIGNPTGSTANHSEITLDPNLTFNGQVLQLSPNLAITNTLTVTNTSASTAAFSVGFFNAANQALTVDLSTASAVTGIAIKSAASGSATTISATDTATNSPLTIQSKGTGTLVLNVPTAGGFVELAVAGNNRFAVTSSQYTFTPGSNTTASTVRFSYAAVADTNLTAGTEAPLTFFNFGVTRQHATGALALQRDFQIAGATDSFVGASTLTDAATLSLVLKNAGTNATFTNSHGLLIQTQALTGTIGNSYGITVIAASGATTNYAARLSGKVLLDVNASLNFSNQTSGAGSGSGTLTNAPSAGNPNFWLPVVINGTTYNIPCW